MTKWGVAHRGGRVASSGHIRGRKACNGVPAVPPLAGGQAVDHTVTCVLASIGHSSVTVTVDWQFGDRLTPASITGSPDAVSNILSTIATSMVTLTTLVLTVTTVTIQLAMGQFSPRIVRALLQDRSSQLAYGLFASTFTFAILALREVSAVGAGTVPGLTVLVAYLLMLASIVELFPYIHHSGMALRAAGLIDLVGDHLREQLNRKYPQQGTPSARPDVVVSPEPGLVIDLDIGPGGRRPRPAARWGVVPLMGDFVPGRRADVSRGRRPPSVSITPASQGSSSSPAARTHSDDPAYGFRKLVDIAERGLVQPFTDPTTAVW